MERIIKEHIIAFNVSVHYSCVMHELVSQSYFESNRNSLLRRDLFAKI